MKRIMIVTFIAILLIITSIIIYLIMKILSGNFIAQLLLFIFYFILVIGTIYKFVKERLEGYDSLKIFDKREEIESNEVIINTLKKMDEYQKIIPIKDGVILINRSGIHIIKLFKEQGILSHDKEFKINDKIADNIFEIEADYYYLIRNIDTVYKLNDINIVNLSQLVLKIKKTLNNPKYDKKQIDELSIKVLEWL